jgi:hypothetical protein
MSLCHGKISDNQFVGFGLFVFPGTNLSMDLTNRFYANLSQSGQEHRFHCKIVTNRIETEAGIRVTTATFAALRIAFDAETKVLSAYYDEDGPACGYSWTLLGSASVHTTWNMTSTNLFGVAVYGHSNYTCVASTNQVFGENFCASSGLTPRLGISRADGKAVLAWTTNSPLCQLKFTITLAPPVCWQVLQDAPSIVGTSFTVTNVVSSDTRFYKLGR